MSVWQGQPAMMAKGATLESRWSEFKSPLYRLRDTRRGTATSPFSAWTVVCGMGMIRAPTSWGGCDLIDIKASRRARGPQEALDVFAYYPCTPEVTSSDACNARD